MRRAPRILVVALVVQILIGVAFVYLASRDFDVFGGGDDQPHAATRAPAMPTPTADRFDERRAFALLREQVERYGPRPAGSAASRRLAERLRTLLPRGRFESLGPEHPGLRNVVGTIPGRRPAIVIGAHYDTEAEPEGHVGVNDGAAGTAAVVEIARALRKAGRPAGAPELRFVLFDGEEEPAGCVPFEECGIRGSRAYVKRHRTKVGSMILLDYVAAKGTRIPREGTSDERMWARLRAAARRVGVQRVFPDRTGVALIDDHTPFLEAGIPAIDLIDFDYPHKDTLEDTVDKTSVRSLDAVGETVVEMVLRMRRARP
jgi:glutaminyl-peptide cyclotransferase